MRVDRSFTTSLLALICAGGCTPQTGPAASPSVEVVDSAGIPVFTLSRLPSWDDGKFTWGLELERAVSTEGSTPFAEPLIYRPQGYARLPDGKLIVLDAGEQRLVVVSATENAVEARFGATGQGPGEIWSSNSLVWPDESDGIWVLDPGNQRLSRFSTSGTLRSEQPVAIPGLGGFAVHRPSTRESFFWKVFIDDPDSGLLSDSIGRLDVELGKVVFFAPMPPRVVSRRRNTSTPVLFAPLGWFAPVGSGVVVGRSDAASFRHYSDEGELLAVIRVPMAPSAIPKSDEPEILEEFYGVVRGSPRTARPEVGEWYPLFNIMWPVDDSLFALQQSHRATPHGETPIPENQFVWRVFSTRGRYAGAIVLPHGTAQPYWIEDGRLMATRRDSLGVATIDSYLLTPPPLTEPKDLSR